jgi:hypothetical protein
MIYTDIELSKVLKVNRSTIYRWRTECAMPVDDLEAARAFAETRKPAIKRIPKVEVDPIPVTGESVYDVRDRLHREEQLIASEVAGLNAALEQARSLNDERSAFKLLQALKSALEDHRRQVDALLKSAARILLLEKNRGSLLDIDVCKPSSPSVSCHSLFGCANSPMQGAIVRRRVCWKPYRQLVWRSSGSQRQKRQTLMGRRRWHEYDD